MNSPKQGVSDLPEICYRHGMRRVVISPGSRNAPLIFSFTGHSLIECHSITDERSAAYFALGLALQTHEPVGLICTSGTAVLNFAPAIAEAFYQNIPLIIITADRPGEWIDQADGQTIRQYGIYKNYIKQSFEVPTETVIDADLWNFNLSVNQAINTALLEPQGPVHLNIPLREPLYNPLPERGTEIRIIKTVVSLPKLTDDLMFQLQVQWDENRKKMVVFGADVKKELHQKLIIQLVADPSVVIVAENISNVADKKVISSPERFFASLTKEERLAFQPDLLITIGRSVVSGQFKKYLRQYSAAGHWHIQSSPSFVDTYQKLTQTIVASPEPLLLTLSENGNKSDSDYRDSLLNKEIKLEERHKKLIGALPFSDLTLFETILTHIPAGANLHLANSTPIRYSQLYEARKDINYHCNRGTSGIDGCVSTAAGFAVASVKPTILITGDISFIYDSNGLWNKYFKGNLKIVVINNGGGNIFNLIDPNDEENPAREFFETPHNVNIKYLAEAFGAGHAFCQSMEELTDLLGWFFAPSIQPYILEIVTDSEVNTAVFKNYYKQIKLL